MFSLIRTKMSATERERGKAESWFLLTARGQSVFPMLYSTGGGADKGEPRLLLPGLRTGSLPAEQGWWRRGSSHCVQPAAPSSPPGHGVRWRRHSQAFRGPGQAHWHYIQSRLSLELPHIQHLLLDHLQSAATRGHPCKVVRRSMPTPRRCISFFPQNQNCLSDLHYDEEMCQEADLLLQYQC